MANSAEGNVHFVDTDDTTLAHARYVKAIKYIGASGGSVTIKAGSSSGDVLWARTSDNDTFEEACIRSKDGLHVTIGSGASVYIYLK